MAQSSLLTDSRCAAARILLEIGAVHISSQQPYRLTSGWFSPVYVDVRRVLSFPAERSTVIEMAIESIRPGEFDPGGFNSDGFDVVAGGESAGIPFAALIADRLKLPMIYVRKSQKSLGLRRQIEGMVREGARVLLVEDHMSDGQSKVDFIQVLRQTGMQASHALTIFFADTFHHTKQLLAVHEIGFRYLTTWRDIMVVAEEGSFFDKHQLQVAREFLESPAEWSHTHGGRSTAK